MSNVNWQPGMTLEEVEKLCILEAVKFYRGKIEQTAESLGIARKTLYEKLKKYEFDTTKERERNDQDKAERERINRRMRGLPEDGSSEPIQPGIPRANEGAYVEPATQVLPKSALPLPEQQEVQGVLPTQAAKAGKGRGR